LKKVKVTADKRRHSPMNADAPCSSSTPYVMRLDSICAPKARKIFICVHPFLSAFIGVSFL
jgi:hypothetical protein